MTARDAVTGLLRFVIRVFYRRIESAGAEKVPRDGAVIFAVNHPNGLLDPLFLLCFSPRPISFLAKAPIFKYPLIGWFAKVFEAIPVYRKQDNTTGSNAETFGRARDLLQRGGTMAIFPEGTTHSDPQLRELKTGAARIALGAMVDPVLVIPAGIYYTAKQTFRSSALVVYGTPIVVKPSVDADGEPRREDAEALTERIDAGLDSVTLQADSIEALRLIGKGEDIFTSDPDQPLATEFDIRKRFVAGYHYLRERDPARLARIASMIERFASQVDPDALEQRIRVATVLRILVLLPLAAIGAVIHYPTYRFVGWLANRLAKGETAVLATIKAISAAVFFPLTWLVAGFFLGWTLLILPFLAWLALRVFEDMDALIGRARALRGGRWQRLVEERRVIREEIARVAYEMANGIEN